MKNNFFNKPLGNINLKPVSNSEVSSQILYGEKFKILSRNKQWIKIKTSFDNYSGYIKNDTCIDNYKPTHKIFKLKTKNGLKLKHYLIIILDT